VQIDPVAGAACGDVESLGHVLDCDGPLARVVCEKVLEANGHYGYNAATEKYEDLVAAGIIDPTKVTRTALQNAASVATLLLTGDAMIAEKPKPKKHEGNGRGGGHDMY
jgi:chaperonin GroEL